MVSEQLLETGDGGIGDGGIRSNAQTYLKTTREAKETLGFLIDLYGKGASDPTGFMRGNGGVQPHDLDAETVESLRIQLRQVRFASRDLDEALLDYPSKEARLPAGQGVEGPTQNARQLHVGSDVESPSIASSRSGHRNESKAKVDRQSRHGLVSSTQEDADTRR